MTLLRIRGKEIEGCESLINIFKREQSRIHYNISIYLYLKKIRIKEYLTYRWKEEDEIDL